LAAVTAVPSVMKRGNADPFAFPLTPVSDIGKINRLSFDFAAPKAGEGTFGGFRAPRTQVCRISRPAFGGSAPSGRLYVARAQERSCVSML